MIIPATKSLNVTKQNSLHQFDSVGIVGVESPVGKVPIVFYTKKMEGVVERGIIYYDDYDSVCFMYPEEAHAEWCKQPYDLKFDAIEPFDNGVERGLRRNWGIFELWASVYREWYNGTITHRASLKIQATNNENEDGYPTSQNAEHYITTVKQTAGKSCGCNKKGA